MATNNNQNNEVTNLGILEFLQEHMVMKEDFDGLKETVATKVAMKEDLKRFATKEDLQNLEAHVMARFATFDRELEDIKIQLARIERTLKEDVDVTVTDLEKLKKRVSALERELGIRQAAL